MWSLLEITAAMEEKQTEKRLENYISISLTREREFVPDGNYSNNEGGEENSNRKGNWREDGRDFRKRVLQREREGWK